MDRTEDTSFIHEMKYRWMRSEVAYSKWASSFGLTLNEVWVLLILGTSDRNSCRQSDLVTITTMPKQTISYVVGQLVKKGYVEHRVEEKDRRSRIVSITEKGRKSSAPLLLEIDEVGARSIRIFTSEARDFFIKMHNHYISEVVQGFYDCIDERKKED